jgi:hypothetical protein
MQVSAAYPSLLPFEVKDSQGRVIRDVIEADDETYFKLEEQLEAIEEEILTLEQELNNE